MPFHTVPLIWRRRQTFPADYRPWLHNEASLTSRLISVAQRFEVEVLASGLERLTRDESEVLGLRSDACAYVREVRLRVDGRAVVLARSAVSLSGLRHCWGSIRSIGQRPLGETLWTNPKIARGPLQFACLTPRHSLYRQLHRHTPTLCPSLPARRSVFWWNGQPLLVMEAFLPAILDLPCPPTP